MAAAGLLLARRLLLQTLVRARNSSEASGIALRPTLSSLLQLRVKKFTCPALFCTERGRQSPSGKPAARPKTVPKTMVTLLGPEKGSMTVVLLEEAEKIARRRSLKLEQVSGPDAKSNRATYRLLTVSSGAGNTASKIIKQDHKEKQLVLTSRIGAHDLESKIKQMAKWVEKRADIRVTISGTESETDEVLNTVEKGLSSCGARILQKRFKGGNLKFTVSPPKEAKKQADSSIEDTIRTAE